MFSVGRITVRQLSCGYGKQNISKVPLSRSMMPITKPLTSIAYHQKYLRKVFVQKATCYRVSQFEPEKRHLFTTAINNDYYKILDVPSTAKKSEINIAFFKLAREYMPGTDGIAPGFGRTVGDKQKFQEVAEAYSVLGDDCERRQYDMYGYHDDQGFREYQQSESYPYEVPQKVDAEEVFAKFFAKQLSLMYAHRGSLEDPEFDNTEWGQFLKSKYEKDVKSQWGEGWW